MKDFLKNFTKEKVKAPFHFASNYHLDKDPLGEAKYHSFSNSKEAEDEYQQLQKNKNKINSLIELTSKALKLEYNKKLEYLKKNLRRIFILSILIIFNLILNLKIFGFSELSVSIIILSSISATVVILLLFNIQTNVLLDLYGYSSFYLFSMFESCILIILYILKIIDFIYTLSEHPTCEGKICWKDKTYYFIIFLNLIIFVGVIFLIKYTLVSFYDAFNVLILKQKTTVQKQMEMNEKDHKLEFAEEDNNNNNINESSNRIMNNSEYKLDSFDNLKTE